MIFTYLDTDYTLPDGLSTIQLQQHIAWSEEWGWSYRQIKLAIASLISPDEKNLSNIAIDSERFCRIFSKYTGIPFDEVQSNISIPDLLTALVGSGLVPAIDEERPTHNSTYSWNSETWRLYTPAESHDADTMSQEEFVIVQQLTSSIQMLATGGWQEMYAVCAAYFRKDGEDLDIAFTQPGNARYEAIKELPLDMAFDIGYYLLDNKMDFYQLINDYGNITLST